jgi:membrane-bound lytic murein transglycosylase A
MSRSSHFVPVTFLDLPGWADDDHAAAYAAFRRSAVRVLEKPYRTGSLGMDIEAFAVAHEEARQAETLTRKQARDFFERHFTPCRVMPSGDASHGFVTGFYEPEAEASPVRAGHYQYPLLSRPADLVDVDDGNRPEGFDPYLAFGRQTRHGVVEYYDRESIESGVLDGQNLEMAWLADPVDVFFIHVQGAARLKMTNGEVKPITYAAKSGQRFTGVGKILAEMGEIPLKHVTMQSIRAWFARHPERVEEILWQNRSFIFFRDAPVPDPALGPIAAAKVQLTAGRSVAVDRLLHTFGTPFFIHAETLTAFAGKPFRRLMVAQDTGSAIVGPARGDLFAGSGVQAGEIAGVIKHPADFYALVPRRLAQKWTP